MLIRLLNQRGLAGTALSAARRTLSSTPAKPASTAEIASTLQAALATPRRSKFLPTPLNSDDKFYKIFQNNKEWVKRKSETDPNFFKKLAQSQSPDYLWIGCADSRVDASEITGLSAGNLFVHRNIANMVVCTDMNLAAVINYAVVYLKIKHILVVGHYGCGGVKTAMGNEDLGVVEYWLRNIREVRRIYNDELMALPDEEARFRRLVELNVREQCLNVLKSSLVQQHMRKHGYPRVHGLVYDLSEGLLKELDLDFDQYVNDYEHIYAVGKPKPVAAAAAAVAAAAPVAETKAAPEPRPMHFGKAGL
jgi:carbonic anhydrase